MKGILPFLLLASMAFAPPVLAQKFVISTFAGAPLGLVPEPQALRWIGTPCAAVADASGNVYFTSMNSVFKVDGSGTITRIAGQWLGGYAGDGGPAVQSLLNFGVADIGEILQAGLAIDAQGNLYVADSGNFRIRKIATDGTITTIAGTGKFGHSGDGGPAASAEIGFVSGMAVDPAGNLYFAASKHRISIRKIAPDGTISTVAASSALAPQGSLAGLAFDSHGNLYVADYTGARVFEVSPDGSVQNIAGTGTPGFSGDGPALSAQLMGPFGIAVTNAGVVYIGDTGNQRVRVVASGNINTIYSTVRSPDWLALGPSGNVILTDTSSARIGTLYDYGLFVLIAGGGTCCAGGDGGPAFSAQLDFGLSWGGALSVDAQGNFYIADTSNLRIRKITPDGIIHTVAGNAVSNEDTGDGGPAIYAQINYPYSVATDNAGNFYLSDGLVRKVSPAGIISTITDSQGDPVQALRGIVVDSTGALREAGWYGAADSSGKLYAADIHNYVVLKIAPDGTTTTVAGNGTPGFSGDGGPATSAQLNTPTAIALDGSGNLYIADCFNQCIRMVTPGGIISTIAGNGSQGYSGDGGDALQAQFGLISGIAVDKNGSIYLADQSSNAIRVLRPQTPAQ